MIVLGILIKINVLIWLVLTSNGQIIVYSNLRGVIGPISNVMILHPVNPYQEKIKLNVFQPISTVLLQMELLVYPWSINRSVQISKIQTIAIIITPQKVSVCGKIRIVSSFHHVLNCGQIQQNLVCQVAVISMLNLTCAKTWHVQNIRWNLNANLGLQQ